MPGVTARESVHDFTDSDNNDNDTALSLLHEMVDKTDHKIPIPRNCYLLLFSHFSTSIEGVDRTEIKTFLDDMYEWGILIT